MAPPRRAAPDAERAALHAVRGAARAEAAAPLPLQQGLDAMAAELAEGARGITGLERLSGGASQETWGFSLRTARGDEPLVLRRAPRGAQARAGGSAGLSIEARLLELAAQAGVPVPRVRGVLRPGHGLGEGFIMERVAGETLGRRIVREERFAVARQALAWQCGKALARIHAVATEALPPLRMAPAPAELAQLMVQHRGYGAARPVFEIAFQWLLRNAPPMPVSPVLVHGDFRNGNLIVSEGGLRAVLDWELAHVGDPMEDLGWICVNAWRFGRSELPVGGFGTREQLVAGYEAEGGRADLARLHYWEVLGTLRWGVICEGMGHAWSTGAEPELEKAAIGRRASESEIDLLALLAPRSRA